MQTETNTNNTESESIITRIIDRGSRATWVDWSERIKSREEEEPIDDIFQDEEHLLEEWDPDTLEEGE